MDQREEGFSFFAFSLKYRMRISSENEEHFFLLCHSMNSLYTCSYRFWDFAGSNLLPMILSTSTLNSCMIQLSIPVYNETIIKNIFKHWTSWTCVPYAIVHRSVLQWTRGERLPLSLYERTFVAVIHFHFMTACYDCIPQTPEKETVFSFSK